MKINKDNEQQPITHPEMKKAGGTGDAPTSSFLTSQARSFSLPPIIKFNPRSQYQLSTTSFNHSTPDITVNVNIVHGGIHG